MIEQTKGDSSLYEPANEGPGPQLAAAKPRRTSNPEHVTEFFDRFHDKIEAMANELNVDKRLILAIGAYESGWFRDQPEEGNYSRSNNNFLGYSKDEIPMKFDTVDENIRQWKSKWGAILRDVGDDQDKLLSRMLQPELNPRTRRPSYQPYNSHKHYESGLREVISTVNDRLPIWYVDQLEKQMSPSKKRK
jgi:hypothetical protein